MNTDRELNNNEISLQNNFTRRRRYIETMQTDLVSSVLPRIQLHDVNPTRNEPVRKILGDITNTHHNSERNF